MTSILRRATWPLAALSAMVIGCGAELDGYQADFASVRKRASFDMNCPEPKILLRGLDDRTIGAEACGQRGTYIKVCQ